MAENWGSGEPFEAYDWSEEIYTPQSCGLHVVFSSISQGSLDISATISLIPWIFCPLVPGVPSYHVHIVP